MPQSPETSSIGDQLRSIKYDFDNVIRPLFYSFIEGSEDNILGQLKAKVEEGK